MSFKDKSYDNLGDRFMQYERELCERGSGLTNEQRTGAVLFHAWLMEKAHNHQAPVIQIWVQKLTLMQQAVLLTAIRGPDGIQKDHVAKVLLRWYRRCVLFAAFGGTVLTDPYAPGGGSFTGPSHQNIDEAVTDYLRSVDELPHHFQLHLMHAAEIIGYKHPNPVTRNWWHVFYCRLVNDAHLNIEAEEQMDKRLGDNEAQWRAAEEVTAK